MPTILLIRHGENDYVKQGRLAGRKPGVHLNEKGREQARALAKTLKGTKLKAVYSSPLERAVETAQPIAAAHKLEVVERDGLLELDMGKWQDRSLKQVRRQKLWRAVQNTPSLARFPGGESFAEAQGRIVRELDTIAARHKPKDAVACIGHSDMIKLAVAYYLGLPLDLFQRLTIAPASITTLFISKNGARLYNLNHLPIGNG
jgi:probable phosphoglycerate mutase